MFTAVSMGIFDKLHGRPATASELATDLNANLNGVTRLLDACTGLGLLTKTDGLYSNTQESETYLRLASPNTLSGYILYSNRGLYPMWANLEDAVREGTNRWEQTFQGGSRALFDHHFATEAQKRTFLSGMNGFGLMSSPHVVAAFDLSAYKSMVDLGGATGHLVLAALDRYPGLEGAVFDLPAVIPAISEYLGGRARAIPGDFFTDPLPPADLYSLGRVLHDWDDEKCQMLLHKIFAALPAGGALLIAEKLLNDDRTGPVHVVMQDLNMLVCTEGRERTLGDFRALLEAAGFTGVDAVRTGAPVDAIIARKRG